MGCCQSLFLREPPQSEKAQAQHHRHQQQQLHHHPPPSVGPEPPTGVATPFAEFFFSDLKAATNNFSPDYIVSESGEKAPNVVYKGRLQNRSWIAVKKFTKIAWPDPKQFMVPFCLNFAPLLFIYLLLLLLFIFFF